MKKNYFLSLICLVAMFAVSALAKADGVADLYGKYKFTATMTLTDAGKAYAEYLSSDCDVTISKDASNIYMAEIDGIAGSTKGGHMVSNYTDGQLIIHNWNDANTGNFDKPIYFSTTGALNPWAGVQFPDLVMTVDAETGVITIPDFTVVSISDWSSETGDILATFTDAKLTLVEKETIDVADVSGEYTYTHGNGTYDYSSESTYSPDYTFSLVKSDDTNKNYTATVKFAEFDAITLPATFDGVTVSIPFASQVLDAEKKIYLGNINGKVEKGTMSYTYVAAGTLAAYSGISIVQENGVDSLGAPTYETLQWFVNGMAKDPNVKPEEASFVGTYTIKGTYLDYADNYSSKTDEFTLTIAKDDYGYYIPEFWGGDISALNYGGLGATVNADNPNQLDIATGYAGVADADTWTYLVYTDVNGQMNSTIPFTINSDGTYSLGQFGIAKNVYGSADIEFTRYYTDLTVTKNEEPAPEPVSIAGDYTYTGTYCTMDDFAGQQKSFNIKIEENAYYEQYGGSQYLLTEFDGTEVYSLNYGGAGLTQTGTDPVVLEIPSSSLIGSYNVDYDAGVYQYKAIYDINGGDGNIRITLNSDGTCSIDDFSYYVYDYMTWAKGDLLGWYSGSKLVNGITNVNASNSSKTAVYSINGRYEGNNTQNLSRGIHIINQGGKNVKVLK